MIPVLRLRLHGPPGRFVKEGAQQNPSLVHKEGALNLEESGRWVQTPINPVALPTHA